VAGALWQAPAVPSILLVRHGQASYGADDYDVLSEIGRRQAEVLAAEHARRGLSFDVIVSGGLRRQQGTAEVLARAAGTPVRSIPDGMSTTPTTSSAITPGRMSGSTPSPGPRGRR
jgi:broad specificity phosphatase PhoE